MGELNEKRTQLIIPDAMMDCYNRLSFKFGVYVSSEDLPGQAVLVALDNYRTTSISMAYYLVNELADLTENQR